MALSSQALANAAKEAERLSAQKDANLDVLAQQKRAEAATTRGYAKTFGRAGYKGPFFNSANEIQYQAAFQEAIAFELENKSAMQKLAIEQAKVKEELAKVVEAKAVEAKKVETIKQEITTKAREGTERTVSRMRARRAGGGLLSAASSPDLAAPATGPVLGSGAPSLGGSMASFGSSSVLGTRVKI